MTELRELVEICQFAGASVLLVQGGGGNGSVKSADGTRMWVKASGTRMSDVTETEGFVETDTVRLLDIVREQSGALSESDALLQSQTAIVGGGGRASMEAGFHAVLGRVVLHTHPVYVNAFTCMEGGREALEAAVADEPVWVPYRAPGHALALEVDRACVEFQRATHRRTPLIVLENHGLIVSGESGGSAIDTTAKIDAAAREFFGDLRAGAWSPASAAPEALAWASRLDSALRARCPERGFAVRAATRSALAGAEGAGSTVLAEGPLVPDDVVYCGDHIWQASIERAAEDWMEDWLTARAKSSRAVIVLEGGSAGVVLVSRSERDLDAMEETALAHVLISTLVRRRGTLRPLSGAAVAHVMGMEAEHYRQAVNTGSARRTSD